MPYSTTPGSIDEAAFRAVFESSPVPMGLGVLGPGGEYRSIRLNDALCALLRRPRAEVESRMLLEFVHPDDREISADFHRVIAGEIEVSTADRRLLMPDGSLVWSRLQSRLIRAEDGTPAYLLTSHQPFAGPSGDALHGLIGDGLHGLSAPPPDELDRLADSRRLVREASALADRRSLDGMSRLASGVAHDIGNLLGVIANYAEIAAADSADEARRDQAMDGIAGALGRGSVLVRQLVQFARDEPAELTEVDLRATVAALRDWLEIAAGPHHGLELDLQPVPPVRADPRLVEQVVVNLVINARDALSVEALPTEGTITVTTAHVPAQPFVEMRVADDGAGMSPDVLAHSTEPFFTTKTGGGSVGLGLSICHGIVELCGGRLHVDSVRGQGTVVTTLWPTEQSPDP